MFDKWSHEIQIGDHPFCLAQGNSMTGSTWRIYFGRIDAWLLLWGFPQKGADLLVSGICIPHLYIFFEDHPFRSGQQHPSWTWRLRYQIGSYMEYWLHRWLGIRSDLILHSAYAKGMQSVQDYPHLSKVHGIPFEQAIRKVHRFWPPVRGTVTVCQEAWHFDPRTSMPGTSWRRPILCNLW